MESLRQEPDIIDVKTAVQTALDHVRRLYEIERDYKQVKIDARSGEVRGTEIRRL